MEIQTDCLAERPDTLLVFLPGAHVEPADFWRYGMVEAVRSRGLAVDIAAVNIDYLHVMAHTVVSTLQEKVIEPALARGYRAIWLAGISLGGLNALMYAARHADLLAGVHLLSPYAGTRDIWQEIQNAGGLQAWRDSPAAGLGEEREAWCWLVDQARAGHPLPVSFGCGEQDRFMATQRLYTEILPAARVLLMPGKHDWPAWQALWNAWLDTCPLPKLEPVT